MIARWSCVGFEMTRTLLSERFDLAVVGAGIIGLATALAAVRRGLRVIVIDRDAQANGASVRNFGFITVTGQERHSMWGRARRTREAWSEVCAAAAIPIVQRGLWMLARHPESVAVLEAFMRTEMAQGCQMLDPGALQRMCPSFSAAPALAALHSDTELRVESRDAVPRLARWLADTHAVVFQRNTSVLDVEVPCVTTSHGTVRADRVAVCPGDDFNGLYAQRIEQFHLNRCRLQMLRLASPGFRLPGAVMSDLSLIRYAGYSELAPAAALRTRLMREQPQHLEHGIHLIVVQSDDGTLIVGDSHHYAATPEPFAREEVDAMILEEFHATLGFAPPAVIERWIGTYASAADRQVLIDAPHPAVRIAIVTCGAGASTCFALGEEIVSSLIETGVAA